MRQFQLTLNRLACSLQNVQMLSQFVTDHSGMILPRTLTGMAPGVCSARCAPVHAPLHAIPQRPFARSVNSAGVCAKQQRKLAKAIKRSRAVGMCRLPETRAPMPGVAVYQPLLLLPPLVPPSRRPHAVHVQARAIPGRLVRRLVTNLALLCTVYQPYPCGGRGDPRQVACAFHIYKMPSNGQLRQVVQRCQSELGCDQFHHTKYKEQSNRINAIVFVHCKLISLVQPLYCVLS
jgi:ribosomal protein S18